jgi:hypothetical protein
MDKQTIPRMRDITRAQIYQQFLDQPRCDIARKILPVEAEIRETVGRVETFDIPRAQHLTELYCHLQKLRQAHELKCPGCGAEVE